ncbi:RHS repeat-associated core domain-containing protein [Myxococcaceae bacterium GXIMD 01537]
MASLGNLTRSTVGRLLILGLMLMLGAEWLLPASAEAAPPPKKKAVKNRKPAPRKRERAVTGPITRSHTFAAGWQLVSVPLLPADTSPEKVFDEVPAPLRLYDSVNGEELGWGEPAFRPVVPGRAFWLLLRDAVTVSVAGTAVDPTREYRVPLRPGWNTLATPWVTRLGWSDARVSVTSGGVTVPLSSAITQGWVEGSLAGFASGAPTTLQANSGGELLPWSGYKVFSNVDGELVLAPPPTSTTPPTVLLATPAQDGDAVTAPTAVLGTVDDDDLVEWRLDYALVGTTDFRLVAEGSEPVPGTSLGTFDPTLLLNGQYLLRLTAKDFAGHTASTTRYVTVRDHLKVGYFTVSFTDLEVPVAGLPIRLTRTYDSRDARQGDFGKGWRLEVSNLRVQENDTPGLAWKGITTGGTFPSYCVQPTKPHVVTVTLPDDTVLEFEGIVEPQCQPLQPPTSGTLTYRPRRATRAALTPVGGAEVTFSGSWPGDLQLFTLEGNLHDPDTYRLDLPDGRSFVVHEQEGLKTLTDLNGNALTFTRNGIQHSSGKGVTFRRNGLGRIEAITDPEGQEMTYGYDARGRLQAHTDREQKTTTYGYNTQDLLASIRDPAGKQPIRNEYDASGRLLRHIDALGKVIAYTHDIAGRQEVVTDREGGVHLRVYDDRGNVLVETNPEGEATRRTFDENSDLLTETDPLNNTTAYTYENRDLTSVKDPEGNITEYTYNARRQVLTAKDPRGKVTRNVYDPITGNQTSAQDAAGNITEYTYDSRGKVRTVTVTVDGQPRVTRTEHDSFGNLLEEVDAAGHSTTYTYDGNGNQKTGTKTRTLPDGQTETLVTRYEYDRNSRLIKAIDPDGAFTRMVYDDRSLQRETYDKRNKRTSYEYDDLGRLVKTTHPDQTTEVSTYDDEGQQLTRKDRANRVTAYVYDRAGRLTKTVFPDSTFTEATYDSAGRLESIRDARGKVTRYAYDNSGRRTKVIDPLGNETVSGYDRNGNLASLKDPNQATTTYAYDDLNRLTKTVFPDGSSTTVTYDSLGQRRTATDAAGRTMRFDYDAVGRLTRVTDAQGEETAYGYDELGNRILHADANGHTTRFEYDALGRETARLLPDGKRETREYDPAGNLKRRVDFMGRATSYEYDDVNRLTRRLYPGSQVSFTYTATGRRETATDPQGTTSYTYDSRDRLESVTSPDGRRLEYGYDAGGNRTTLTARMGARVLRTAYAYDDANRLDVVIDPLNRSYDLGYDRNGNRERLAHPNGTTTNHVYDALNRLKELTTTGPSGIVQSYALTLGPSGNRERIDEHGGAFRQYAYDDVYRLTGEKVTVNGASLYEKTFGYDVVGNRLTQVTAGTASSGPLAPASITYAYDARDRLLTETGRSFTYDDNGNLTEKVGQVACSWDIENRLIKVTALTSGTVVDHAYDVDGNRIQTAVTPAGGTRSVTNYVVDTSGALAQVVAEADAAGGLRAYYVRADDLLAVMRPSQGEWSTRYFHADALGSVRRLTDDAGNVVDGYSYTAFGELISHTGSDPQPYGFAGESFEPSSGLSYNRARWMDPQVGRFISMDPWGGDPFEPLTLHAYLYAAADPVNRLDPSGRFFSFAPAFASLGAMNTIAAISLPMAQGLVAAPHVDLVPILVKSETWSGWPHLDVDVQLLTAKRYWEDKAGTGYRVNIRTEIGPNLEEVGVRSSPFFKEDLFAIVRRQYQGAWPLSILPVVFLGSIGGRDVEGASTTQDPWEQAAIAVRYGVLTSSAPPERTLAHEVGHTLGLANLLPIQPWRLMNGAGPIGTHLISEELDRARNGFRTRTKGK